VPDDDAAFTAVHAPDFDPAQVVVVENGRALDQSPGQHTLQILRYDLNEAAFAVTNDKPAYLLLADMAHPDWQAWDNGRVTPIFTADYALRAVFLEPGTHEILFRYRPAGWRLGLVVSGVTWGIVGLFVCWFVGWQGKRPSQISQQIP
ncbi:MAG: YfhO family protein, partial [Anaerolineae bacterium]